MIEPRPSPAGSGRVPSGCAYPLVGRTPELAALRHQLDRALAGFGGLVLVGGEAGIGKTALAEAIGGEAAARGVRVAVGRCFDLTDTPPYGPWRDLFAGFADLAERLVVSPRTVNTHLTSIYNKLGVASRNAAIRFALEHGLRC